MVVIESTESLKQGFSRDILDTFMTERPVIDFDEEFDMMVKHERPQIAFDKDDDAPHEIFKTMDIEVLTEYTESSEEEIEESDHHPQPREEASIQIQAEEVNSQVLEAPVYNDAHLNSELAMDHELLQAQDVETPK